MIIPSDYKECVELIQKMDNKIRRLQLDKRILKMKLKVTPGGRTLEYKSKIAQHLILKYLHQGKDYDELIYNDNDCRIKGHTLQEFRNRISKNL